MIKNEIGDLLTTVLINGQEMALTDGIELEAETLKNSEPVIPMGAAPVEHTFECTLKEAPPAALFNADFVDYINKHNIGDMVWIWQNAEKKRKRKHARGGYYIRAKIKAIHLRQGTGILNGVFYKVYSKKKIFLNNPQRKWLAEDQVFKKKPKTAPNRFFDALRVMVGMGKIASAMAKLGEITGVCMASMQKFSAAVRTAEVVIDTHSKTEVLHLEKPQKIV